LLHKGLRRDSNEDRRDVRFEEGIENGITDSTISRPLCVQMGGWIGVEFLGRSEALLDDFGREWDDSLICE
jgi:hypothetical protein